MIGVAFHIESPRDFDEVGVGFGVEKPINDRHLLVVGIKVDVGRARSQTTCYGKK